jgi:hypothetical protein
MRVLRGTKRLTAATVIVVSAAVLALLPLGATAARAQHVTWGAGGRSFDIPTVTVTQLNANRVRIEYHAAGFGGSEEAPVISGDWDATPVWNVDLDQMRGTVSGSLLMRTLPPIPSVRWDGYFHGTLTPTGASGSVQMTAGNGLRFVGTWTTANPNDPRPFDPSEGLFWMFVDGVLIGDVPT